MCDIENRDIDNKMCRIAGVESFGEYIPEFLLKSFLDSSKGRGKINWRECIPQHYNTIKILVACTREAVKLKF